MDTVLIVAVISLLSVLLTSFLSPMFLGKSIDKRQAEREATAAKIAAENQERTWKREDQVAERAKQAAKDLADSQAAIARKTDEVARKTDAAAELLLAEQKKTNEKTDEVAVIAAQTAAQQDKTAKDLTGRLDDVHTLVNSAYDAALDGKLTALEQSRALLLQVRALRDEAGDGVDPKQKETNASDLTVVEAKISELQALIADRARQNAKAAKQRQDAEVIVRVGSGPDVDVKQEPSPHRSKTAKVESAGANKGGE